MGKSEAKFKENNMYKPINGFTKQTILDVIKARPFEEAAIEPVLKGCTYLAPNGNKCGVGLFIPDGHPGQKSTNFSTHLFHSYPDLLKVMPLESYGMDKIQEVHDSNIENAKTKMIEWVEANVEGELHG